MASEVSVAVSHVKTLEAVTSDLENTLQFLEATLGEDSLPLVDDLAPLVQGLRTISSRLHSMGWLEHAAARDVPSLTPILTEMRVKRRAAAKAWVKRAQIGG